MIDSIIFNNVAQSINYQSDMSQKLKLLTNKSSRVLLKASSVFPFDLFPDEISIDGFKVSIISHDFFMSEDIHSVPIDMIKDIELYLGPLFATLRIVPDGYPGHGLEVSYLKRADALKARRIIEGLIISRKQGIDPMELTNFEHDKQIEEIGSTHLAE